MATLGPIVVTDGSVPLTLTPMSVDGNVTKYRQSLPAAIGAYKATIQVTWKDGQTSGVDRMSIKLITPVDAEQNTPADGCCAQAARVDIMSNLELACSALVSTVDRESLWKYSQDVFNDSSLKARFVNREGWTSSV